MPRTTRTTNTPAHEYRRHARRGASATAGRMVYQFTADDMQSMRQSITSIAVAMMIFGAKLRGVTLRDYVAQFQSKYAGDPGALALFEDLLATEKGGA